MRTRKLTVSTLAMTRSACTSTRPRSSSFANSSTTDCNYAATTPFMNSSRLASATDSRLLSWLRSRSCSFRLSRTRAAIRLMSSSPLKRRHPNWQMVGPRLKASRETHVANQNQSGHDPGGVSANARFCHLCVRMFTMAPDERVVTHGTSPRPCSSRFAPLNSVYVKFLPARNRLRVD